MIAMTVGFLLALLLPCLAYWRTRKIEDRRLRVALVCAAISILWAPMLVAGGHGVGVGPAWLIFVGAFYDSVLRGAFFNPALMGIFAGSFLVTGLLLVGLSFAWIKLLSRLADKGRRGGANNATH